MTSFNHAFDSQRAPARTSLVLLMPLRRHAVVAVHETAPSGIETAESAFSSDPDARSPAPDREAVTR
jgi:hypothetical protein